MHLSCWERIKPDSFNSRHNSKDFSMLVYPYWLGLALVLSVAVWVNFWRRV
jgi:hypothetical protein